MFLFLAWKCLHLFLASQNLLSLKVLLHFLLVFQNSQPSSLFQRCLKILFASLPDLTRFLLAPNMPWDFPQDFWVSQDFLSFPTCFKISANLLGITRHFLLILLKDFGCFGVSQDTLFPLFVYLWGLTKRIIPNSAFMLSVSPFGFHKTPPFSSHASRLFVSLLYLTKFLLVLTCLKISSKSFGFQKTSSCSPHAPRFW